MRVWKKLLIGFLFLSVILVTGLVLFVALVDPNEYRGAVADLVEDLTGRDLEITGDLRIKVLPVPSVEAHDVTFSNAPWATEPDMVRARSARAELALLPLLKGRLLVHRLVAIEPEVFLEVDADGRPNWTFDDGGEEPAPGVDAQTGATVPGFDITIEEIRVENGGLDYLDQQVGTRIKVDLEKLTAGVERPGGPLRMSMRGTYQDLPVTLDGRLGAPGAILHNQPVEVDLRGTAGDADFTVQGAVGKPLEARLLRLDVALKSTSTRSITDAVGMKLEEFGPADLEARLLEEDGYFHLESIAISARPRNTDANIAGSVKNFDFDLVAWSPAETPQRTPLTVNLEGKLGEAGFRVDAEVGNPLEGRDVRADVAFETPATRPLTELAGVDIEELGAVALAMKVVEQEGRFDFEDIDLRARPRDTDATMAGSVKGVLFAVDGGSARGKPAKVDVEGIFGDAKYAVAGDIGKPMEGKDLRLKVRVDAKFTRPLTEAAGVDMEEVGPLSLKLTVVEKDGRIDLDAIDVKARPRKADVAVRGSVANVIDDPKPDLDIALSADTLRQLDQTLPEAGPVSVSAKVRPKDKVIEIRDLIARVGKSDLSGSATVDTGGERPSASAKLRAGVLDLAELVPAAETPDTPAAADKSDTASDATRDKTGTVEDGQTTGRKVFSDASLPFEMLKKANGSLELVVEKLITRKLTLDKVDLAASLDDGNLTIKPAAHVAGGTIGGTIDIDARTLPAKIAADVGAKKVSIGALTKELRGYETSRGLDTDLTAKLQGQGNSVRDLMSGLNGDLRLEVGEGRLKNDVLDKVGADLLSQIIGIAVPKDADDDTTQLNCAVVRFAVVDGDAIADQTIVLETDKVLVKGGGLVDLKTEELDLGAKLAARQGIRIGAGTLSSLAKLQGTLGEPRLGTDLTGVVTAGTKVGIAFVTVGLSLVAEGVYGHLSEDEHPCQTALARQMKVTPKEYKDHKAAEEN
jgi:uncharacterized protein involved in outer membrane biogenesis